MAKSIYDLPTPAVLVDQKKLNNNIEKMAQTARMTGVKLRPHIKAHKTLEIARLQMKAGAVGITTATIQETVVMARGGLENIVLAAPLWGDNKLSQAARLMERIQLTLLIVDPVHGEHVDAYFRRRGIRVPVLLKIDTGLGRCGRRVDEISRETVERILHTTHLDWRGWLTHAGHSYGATSPEQLQEIAQAEGESLVGLQRRYGPAVGTVSVGSTPTAAIAAQVAGVTEIRPGNYVFYDRMQQQLGVAGSGDLALTVLAQVIDSTPDRVILDAGAKSLGLDAGVHGHKTLQGYGKILNTDLTLARLSEEHGIVSGNETLQGGQFVEIMPNHACPVANLASIIYIRDGEDVLDTFDVAAKGHQWKRIQDESC